MSFWIQACRAKNESGVDVFLPGDQDLLKTQGGCQFGHKGTRYILELLTVRVHGVDAFQSPGAALFLANRLDDVSEILNEETKEHVLELSKWLKFLNHNGFGFYYSN